MPTVQIADIIEPSVFNDYITQNTMQRSAVYASGLLAMDSDLSNKLAGGGRTFEAPAWGDLADDDPTESNDDPTNKLVLGKIGTYQETARRISINKGWAATMFASELAGSDGFNRIGDRVADYWARQWNKYTVATALGVFGSNIANNGGDMYLNAGAANMSGTVCLDAGQRLGDASEKLSIMLVHSQVQTRMRKAGLLTNAFRPEYELSARPLTMYMDKYIVVVDDSMPNGNPATLANPGGGASVNGTALAANEYVSFLAAPGAIAMGETSHKKPVYIDEDGLAGGGSGEEQIVTRKIVAFHPRGHRFLDTAVAGASPTKAEINNAANWSRTYPEQKQMGMVAVKTTE